MSHEENDKPIRDLIARSLPAARPLPHGFRRIEAMLDKARGRPFER